MKIRILTIIWLLAAVGVSAQPLPPPSVPRADDGSVIDVLVLYTDNARAIAGGSHPQALAMIGTALTGVNQALATAGVATQLNAVAYQPVFYLEQVNVDFHADLNNLSGTADGYLDDIHALRDFYAADLVLMVTGTWFYIYTGDSDVSVTPAAADGFAVWEARGLDDNGGIEPARWIARLLGVDDAPPFDGGQVATMNANRTAVANYRDSADRVIPPLDLTQNASFEVDMDANGVPDFWAASGWSGDKLICGAPSTARTGGCAVRFKLNATASFLNLPASGAEIALNDEIDFSVYARSTSNACMTMQIVVKYAESPKAKSSLKTCISASSSWTHVGNVITTTDFVTGVQAKIKVTGTGKLWLDDAALIAAPSMLRGGGR